MRTLEPPNTPRSHMLPRRDVPIVATKMSGLSWIFARLTRALSVFMVGLLVTTQCAFAGTTPLRLVIVTNVASDIDELSQTQIRQIYLGAPGRVSDKAVQPLVNRSNRVLHEIFLQKVLFTSAKTYEHHIAHRKFAANAPSPLVYRSESKLIDYLTSHPNSIACLPEQAAAKLPSLRVIARL